ncbi:ribosome recycling factor [Caloranaerobacter azorensis]|uniref:Ribosome-recycling factor n=3 Tax=Caloranaerobacter azorensis TaxID=116090 RepID=A0A1M5VEC3_9FIRM|nr:ribosome recycling factor [Caloranaerobacter azorensis]KGG80834.1 ribosome recycling factor [Caloranaerobacter azorensis H53214]QIB26163.1 ribosome recycling factor [Caloranaerobacter azorensis]SHH73597.1 ribosome recycling factor [Caloranaerobacter azorensis DSM 13643]
MYLEIHKTAEEKMKKTLKVYKDEITGIKAGRANPALLDRIMVDYYGTPTPLKQIANISAPEPRLLVIQAWDANAVSAIEKAIIKSDLGLNPSVDNKVIRLNIPQLTEERRKELIKHLKKLTENAKVAIRNERRDANEHLKKMEKTGELTQDDLRKAEEEVQKLTDKYIEEINKLFEKKEKELLEV